MKISLIKKVYQKTHEALTAAYAAQKDVKGRNKKKSTESNYINDKMPKLTEFKFIGLDAPGSLSLAHALSASNSPFDNMFKSSLVNGKEVSGGEVDVEYRHLPKSIFSLVFSKLGLYWVINPNELWAAKKEDYIHSGSIKYGSEVWLQTGGYALHRLFSALRVVLNIVLDCLTFGFNGYNSSGIMSINNKASNLNGSITVMQVGDGFDPNCRSRALSDKSERTIYALSFVF